LKADLGANSANHFCILDWHYNSTHGEMTNQILLLILLVCEVHGAGSSTGSSLDLVKPLMAVTDNVRKIYENVRCVDGYPLTKGLVEGGLEECKKECLDDPECVFYAFWLEKNYCETYDSCYHLESDGDNVIHVFKRMSHCDVAQAVYSRMIPKYFPAGTLKIDPPNPNLYCKCISRAWMFCVIYVAPGTGEYNAVTAKLNRKDPEKMKPFESLPSRTRPPEQRPIIFRQARSSIIAEIETWPPGKCFHVSKCTRGTPGKGCPFTGKPFKSGDPVYVLRGAMAEIERGTPVSCYSMMGFRDGYREKPEIEVNYAIYLIFDDADMQAGYCAEGISKFKNTREDINLGVPDDVDFSQPEGPPRGRGRGSVKMRLSQKVNAGGSGSSSAGAGSSSSSSSNSNLVSVQVQGDREGSESSREISRLQAILESDSSGEGCKCVNGHPMVKTFGLPFKTNGEKYKRVSCDSCKKSQLEKDGYFYHCPPCMYDFCKDCAAQNKAEVVGRVSTLPNSDSSDDSGDKHVAASFVQSDFAKLSIRFGIFVSIFSFVTIIFFYQQQKTRIDQEVYLEFNDKRNPTL